MCNMRILIVDDSPTFRRAIYDALEDAGYEVEMARNGDEGVELARSWKPHLIVMDIEMPVRGDQAASELRCDPEMCDVPIIAMTGVSPETLGEKAKLFNDYLTKPFGFEDLVPKVRKLLGE